MPIGSRIKSLRLQKGLTQKELGDLCGMADSAIRRYESDRGNPTEKTLRRIADALGVSVSHLTGEVIHLNIPMPDYPVRLPSEEEIERMAPAELEYYRLRLLADTAPDRLKKQLMDSYDKLNKLGQVEAVRRTAELSVNPKYTEPDRNNTTPEDK